MELYSPACFVCHYQKHRTRKPKNMEWYCTILAQMCFLCPPLPWYDFVASYVIDYSDLTIRLHLNCVIYTFLSKDIMTDPVPIKQHWWIWVKESFESKKGDDKTTTKRNKTKVLHILWDILYKLNQYPGELLSSVTTCVTPLIYLANGSVRFHFLHLHAHCRSLQHMTHSPNCRHNVSPAPRWSHGKYISYDIWNLGPSYLTFLKHLETYDVILRLSLGSDLLLLSSRTWQDIVGRW